MKFFLLSDNIDTQMGMRLAGIPGVVVHEESEVCKALDEALNDDDIAVILMTDKIMHMIEETVNELKLSRSRPLIVEIPD
ncbi:MAG: V-type ATP synthase subunit F, partial [Oscillospiraceae bacterium]|nr:V-type ATP synthase subunit F [Oscillospiraceae bacterium]